MPWYKLWCLRPGHSGTAPWSETGVQHGRLQLRTGSSSDLRPHGDQARSHPLGAGARWLLARSGGAAFSGYSRLGVPRQSPHLRSVGIRGGPFQSARVRPVLPGATGRTGAVAFVPDPAGERIRGTADPHAPAGSQGASVPDQPRETHGGLQPGQSALLPAFRDSAPDPEEVRTILGVSLDDQRGWANTPAALREWRDALYEVGVFVFKDAFRQDDYCGFSIYDPELPVIYVNSSRSATRQIFTLFHELGHLLHETSGLIRRPPTFWIACRRRAGAWRPAVTALPLTCCHRQRSGIS